MKRWTLRILLCLILGAITTVAVAWAIVNTVDVRGHHRVASTTWKRHATNLYHPVDAVVHRFATFGYEVIRLGLAPAEAYLDSPHTVEDVIRDWSDIESRYHALVTNIEETAFVAVGWPQRALHCTWHLKSPQGRAAEVFGAMPSPFDGSSPTVVPGSALPFIPIWPGFLIDTLFFATIWGALLCGFISAKRALRARPGRCPQCGYDLRGDLKAGCPECGWNRRESGFPPAE